jgi:hypothetical protein
MKPIKIWDFKVKIRGIGGREDEKVIEGEYVQNVTYASKKIPQQNPHLVKVIYK